VPRHPRAVNPAAIRLEVGGPKERRCAVGWGALASARACGDVAESLLVTGQMLKVENERDNYVNV
jgi:hypothetical protein